MTGQLQLILNQYYQISILSYISECCPLYPALLFLFCRFSGLLHPPVSLIAECIDCLAVMAENEAEEVWQHLAQTGFLPQLIGTAEKSVQ